MKLFKKIAKGLIPVFATLLIASTMVGRAYAIPYSGDTTPPAPSPAFNVFTGVPSEGNESDFFRGKVEGDTNASVNDVNTTCETGKKLTLRVYVHNGASQDLNGNGTGASVAHGTKVKVDLKNASAASAFNPTANISSTAPALSVNDDMNIHCTDGKQVKLSYVADSAKQFTGANGSEKLSDNIVTSGALIGTKGPNGDVWGCWEQRVYVTFTVTVTEVPPVVTPSDAVCKLDNGAFVVTDNKKRTVKGSIKADLTNATVTGYSINWGDGSTSTKQSDTHTYAADGTYKIQASVTVKLANGTSKTVDGTNCSTTVTFSTGKPPVVVTPPTTTTTVPAPTELVHTGAANTFGIFAATSLIGAVLHRMYSLRKASQL